MRNFERMRRTSLAEGRIGLTAFNNGGRTNTSLIAFPFAGGSSPAFNALFDYFPPDWRMTVIDPPGNPWTAGQPLEDVGELASLFLKFLPVDMFRGAILLGHSLGAYIAFEVASRLIAFDAAPKGLVLQAARPPQLAEHDESLADLDDQALHRRLRHAGDITSSEQLDLITDFLPCIRAGLRAFENYRPLRSPLPIPSLVLAGSKDPLCELSWMGLWRQYLSLCELGVIEGHHFFLNSNPQACAGAILEWSSRLNLDCSTVRRFDEIS